ncbi:choline dehydrogenase [Ancylobacter sp. Lp-2]|uniref:choline dehydrogenase n=1 Tax=Ancylobacter sp. Lp-2 TaxID=2881339 RepID=UPI001E5B7E43|nr:choline dehydrogenase [Ancylobacter sp. Lp-2]MCB4770971.1 choline dehydrogenase [Ancylobacter sp. Lp-2]
MAGTADGFDQEFDYIIVGAGSAGCVLADRLTASGENRVLVLEFGGSDRSIFIQMPSALSIPMNMPRYSWMYESEPEPGLGGRRMHCPRGKVLGGSSSINGMVYVRGNPADFDGWQEQGAQGWSYADVLPYFRRAESRQEGGDAYRGSEGPLATRYGSLANPLHHAFIDAALEAGYPASEDINGYAQEGFGRMDMTVKDGVRWSAAKAYLRPAMQRANLKVETHARVTRVLFEGRRAIGVAYEQGDVRRQAKAAREVILAGGPVNSPQLLKLSGVGPGAELRGHGIEVVADRAGVGENLQDHLEFYFQVACKQPITLYSSMGLAARAGIGLRWLLRKDGLGATNHFESCGFIRSRPGVAYPDVQYHFLPLAVTYDGQGLASEHGFQAHVGPMRSKSRGWVRLRSADPAEKPRLFFNYMSHPDDWTEMRACVRLTREIFAQKAFDPYRGREIQPGADVVDDEAIDAFIRDKVESAYHPSCTCKMGAPADPMAVVDPQARVIGVEGLRVVDSSIMPSVTTGNLNAPTIMLAEKAADHILGRPALAPSNAPYYKAANWQHAQR